MGRPTQGVRVMNMSEDDLVSAVALVVESGATVAARPRLAATVAPDSTTSATALTRSPSLMFITLTPWVARPICEIPPALVRWTMPFWEMNSSSWCSRTISAPARPPFFSVSLIVSTPFVPRPLTG